ncbi:carbon storage regulator [Zavarzinella formosa]|uniref:carbon storage regulator n=1 Tax=Zavarzinella formosa TaxID=360055 RepID=UPI00031C9944|nr:carbon storage regulator [Zavarzinella formosa]
MVILTRKPGDEIILGRNIHVRLLSAPGGFVRVGIEDPNVMVDTTGRVISMDDREEPEDDVVDLFPTKAIANDDTVALPCVEVFSEGWAGVM